MQKIPSGRFTRINPIKAFIRTNFTEAGFNPVQIKERVRIPHLSVDNPENCAIFSHLSQMKPALETYAKAKGVIVNMIAPPTIEGTKKTKGLLQRALLFIKPEKKYFNVNDWVIDVTDVAKKKTETVGFQYSEGGLDVMSKSILDAIDNGVENLNGSSKFVSLF